MTTSQASKAGDSFASDIDVEMEASTCVFATLSEMSADRSSSSRTPVAEAAGARTQLTNVVGALSIAVLLLVAPNLLQHLPNSALAAVVIAATS